MIVTLCGSARFEEEYKEANRKLTLAGHLVFSIAVYPSDMGSKIWYTGAEKEILDAVHKAKIDQSEAIYVIAPGNYVGPSTQSEIDYAKKKRKKIFSASSIPDAERTCPFVERCSNPLRTLTCDLCSKENT